MGFPRYSKIDCRDVRNAQEGVQEPLLHAEAGTASFQHHHSTHQQPELSGTTQSTSASSSRTQPAVDLGWTFLRRIWRILKLTKAAPAVLLAVLAVMEAIIISRIGTVSSAFYKVFVDGQQSAVLPLMLWSGGCYIATALFYTIKSALQDFFAWRWRARLTLHLQHLYISNLAFFSLKGVDNPDQRLAQDLPLLTSSLADTLAVLAAAPFNVIWYTQLTYQVFGSWLPVSAAYAFFAVGVLLQRCVMLPVAGMVYRQEAAEGAYRYKQMRVRAWATEIALYRSASVEQQHLDHTLSEVLSCQGKLVLRRAAVTAVTKLLEYGGLVVNFGCLAVAVFSGVWDTQRSTAGGVAAQVSVASFYLLTLIYSFTQVLDLASKVSNLAGLTARVSQLLEELQSCHSSSIDAWQQQQHATSQQQQECALKAHTTGQLSKLQNRQKQKTDRIHVQTQCGDSTGRVAVQQQQQQQPQPLVLVGDGTAPSHKRYASQAVTLQPPMLVTVPAANHTAAIASQHSMDLTEQQQQQLDVMQISIHSLGADVLMHEVRRAFPDSPRLAPLTAVVTFQFCGTAKQLMLQQWRRQQQQQQKSVGRPGSALAWGLMQQQQQQHLQACQRAASAPLPCDDAAYGASHSSTLQQQQQCEMGHGSVLVDAMAAAADPAWQQQQQASSTPFAAAAASAAVDEVNHGSPTLAAAAVVRPCPCGSAATAGVGCSCLCSSSEMESMLNTFLSWQQQVCGVLTARGYWADALDPRTGRALSGQPGTTYDEVIGAKVLLGYKAQQQNPGGCLLISHPLAGTKVYPATLFTSAPLPVVKEAIKAAAATAEAWTAGGLLSSAPVGQDVEQQQPCMLTPCANPGSTTAGSSSSSTMNATHQLPRNQGAMLGPAAAEAAAAAAVVPTVPDHKLLPLLQCTSLSVSTPSGVPIVKDLNLTLTAAATMTSSTASSTAAAAAASVASLLIRGPSGCGKSTLLKCLAGLWPADAGRYSVPATAAKTGSKEYAGHGAAAVAASAAGVVFVPQRMLAAPGHSLREQLVYPASETAAGYSCCCCCCAAHDCSANSSSSTRWGGKDATSSVCRDLGSGCGGDHIQKQQQQQFAPGNSAEWWSGWLSCRIHRRLKLQEQNRCWPQQYCGLAAATAAGQMCHACWQMHTVLQQVGLSYLLGALPNGLESTAEDWGLVLSPGEMQRVGFARVLLHKPLLAVFDEATSSLPGDVAVQLYQQLQLAGISYVSVGHSSSLLAAHRQVLSIEGDGTGRWQLQQLA